MSYSSTQPDYYRVYQPDTPYHAGAPGWRSAPVPGWGQNPVLRGPRRVADPSLGLVAVGAAAPPKPFPWSFVAIAGGVALLGYALWRSTRMTRNGRYYDASRQKRSCRRAAAEDGGPYLLPGKRYPVPTKTCAHRALTFASWPSNVDDVPDVIRAMKKTEWGRDAGVRERMRNLAADYRRETGGSVRV